MGIGIRTIVVGPLQVNCYLVYDELNKEAMVIDPGDEPERILEYVEALRLDLKKIVCTHSHFDHIGGLPEIKASTGVKIYLHKDELSIYNASRDMAAFWGYQIDPLPKPEMIITEGDTVMAGKHLFKVIHTPGHSPGSICLYSEEGVIFTGDTLFAGSVGRTDLPGGSVEELKASFRRLMKLPDKTAVYPGHGPDSNIGYERKFNFFNREV
ncbi:MAG: MBL fold metallo-hydrolase [Candidatus Magnetoovum sp. WYHC-5]|nr:MBL fold metallo-hydrolase [Candidatus Magnetoovum sp. WYHC-5]